MTQQEYEQQKRECWEEFMARPHENPQSLRRCFDFSFDRAYALGKQEKDLVKATESGRVEEPKHHIPDATKMMDGIIRDGFREHNRLHIAAMAMQGLLSNQKWMEDEWERATDAVEEDDYYDYDEAMTELVRYIATEALEYADALMKAAGKGGGE